MWHTYASQSLIPYAIAPFAWLGDDVQRLLFGSVDKSAREVSQLQEFLNTHDAAALTVTGIFDQATDEAYRSHQRWGQPAADGICENADWLVKAQVTA